MAEPFTISFAEFAATRLRLPLDAIAERLGTDAESVGVGHDGPIVDGYLWCDTVYGVIASDDEIVLPEFNVEHRVPPVEADATAARIYETLTAIAVVGDEVSS